MIVFLRSHDAKFDGRLKKYTKVLDGVAESYKILCWVRSGIAREVESSWNTYSKNAQAGSGWSNALKLLNFNLWIFRELHKNKNNYKIIHAVDFDTIIPAYVIGRIYKKKVIYDVYDSYASSRNIKGIMGEVVNMVEKFFAENASEVIFPNISRVGQLKIKRKNFSIIENVPMDTDLYKKNTARENKPISFSYVGILEKNHRGIENIVKFFELNKKFVLNVAGYGEMTDYVRNIANNNSNIIFHGSVSHDFALNLMCDSDVILGLYYKTVPNHLFASPNKYYEHLMLGKPMVTSVGTPPGDLVTDNGSGIVVEDNYISLENALKSLGHRDIDAMGNFARDEWEKKYANYFDNYLKPTYIKIIFNKNEKA